MAKIISLHSFRGGTGKSNITANVAAVMAEMGYRIGVVDTDIQSPGIHVLLGLDSTQKRYTVNDYLWGDCAIDEATHDVTPALEREVPGRIYLIPASVKPNEIGRVVHEGFSVRLLMDGFRHIMHVLKLDALYVDTHPGLSRETLLSIALADILIVVLRPDAQDYLGTHVTLEVARQLDLHNLLLVVNKVPKLFDMAEVEHHISETYGCEVAGILPHSDQMMHLASEGIFAMRHTTHPLTQQYRRIAQRLLAKA